MIARGLVLILAVVACAWFGLGARQAHEVGAATAIVSRQAPLKAGQVRHATELLDSVSALNPDLEIDVLRARLQIDEGHLARARQTLLRVIRREPKLLDAWVWYLQAAVDDPLGELGARVGIARIVRTFPSSH